MRDADDWRQVYEFWFPPGLDDADAQTHRGMFERWFGGGTNAALPRFAHVLEAALAGRLDHWRTKPLGRLSLIIVLDQFPRGLFAGTPAAFAADPTALAIAEEGLAAGQYDALSRPWEKLFFLLPLAHAEGPDHRSRLERVVGMADIAVREAPARLQGLYAFSAFQARGHLDVVLRFGRFPHRNAVLGRESTEAELAYLSAGNFVHKRRPPDG